MMIVIVHNRETQQAQMLGENTDPEMAMKLLRHFADGIEQQQAQAAAQANGGHQRTPSGLILPPAPAVPRDITEPPK